MTPPADRPEWGPREGLTLLNTDIPRVDGPQKVSGRARYTHDMRLPGMLYARLVVCPHPRAVIESQSYRKAARLPGVALARAFKEVGDDVRYQGDDAVVGAVLGETPEAADAGLAEVKIDYEVLEPLVHPDQTLAEGAPGIGRGGQNESGASSRGEKAQVAEALKSCDAIVQATYRVPVQHHVCLETHGVVVDYRGGDEATVYHSSQAVTGSNRFFAEYLDLPTSNVRVICEHTGGGFGAKFGPGIEGRLACELAVEMERPVHLMLSREDEFLMAGNRSGSVQEMVGGATQDGAFKALAVEAQKLGGMGGGSLPTPPYIYTVEHCASNIRSVHTATDSNRAMRAPGHPQASFAMESMVDELAAALGHDPLEFRKQNLSDPVHHRQLDRVAREIGWFEHPHRTGHGGGAGSGAGDVHVGIGFGVSIWSSRSQPLTVVDVRIEPDGSIQASTGVQDIGQGSRTLVAAIVAEEFGLSARDVHARIGDSSLPPAVYSGGSITTGSIGPSIKDGAHKARVALEASVAPALGVEPGQLSWSAGQVHVSGDPSRSLSWGQACATLGTETLQVSGTFQSHLRDEGVHGAQAAKVEVDTLTGRVRVLKMVAIQDQGIPLNRLACRSQINGGMIQALSFALFEERVHDLDSGALLSGDLEHYKIAGCQEMPELVAIIDDDDTRPAVMGMAEAPVIPGHSAIANAIYNACGLRLREMPFTPDKVLMALSARA